MPCGQDTVSDHNLSEAQELEVTGQLSVTENLIYQ